MGKNDTTNDNNTEDDFDVVEYRKFLSNMFPSKHMKNKVDADKKMKDKLIDTENMKKRQRNRKIVESEDESESESQDDSSENESDDEPVKKKKKDINIVFTISDKDILKYDKRRKLKKELEEDESDEENSDEDDSQDEDYETEESDEDEEEEDYESEESEEEEEEEDKTKKKKDKKAEDMETPESKEELLKLSKFLKDHKESNPTIQKCIQICDAKLKEHEKKEKKLKKKETEKNLNVFKKNIKDKNLKDISYYKNLSVEEQLDINKKVDEINEIIQVKKPYRFLVLESDIPAQFKASAMNKINAIRHMDPGCGEYYKMKNWVDNFMRLPFNKFNDLNVCVEDGVEKCHSFMENAQKTLDEAVYGLNDAKLQIMQMLGQFITNPKAIGTSIAIHGPPGTGKTSLVKEGISKILNRPFEFIALGGATDSSVLEGHSYTYEGSTWGKIVQILIDSKCMNPIIYFDELDKVSDTPRGEEIIGILTHLTDTTQNTQFHDKYFSEISLDLSKCLFIFSYNDESKINPILKDRMYRIQTKGYSNKQKNVIVNNYLLPRIREQVKFTDKDIIIPNDTISYMMENENICYKEKGVRNMKRCLEIIYTKLNLFRLMKSNMNLFEEDMAIKVEFPITVTRTVVDKLIKNDKENISALYSMYM